MVGLNLDICGISFSLEPPPIANKLIKMQTQTSVPILEIIFDACFFRSLDKRARSR